MGFRYETDESKAVTAARDRFFDHHFRAGGARIEYSRRPRSHGAVAGVDTSGKWGREQILGDFVRVIRYFRPEIIVSRFTGTPRDGHGHHQVAGIITQEAFKAAADPNRFPEYGKPWQAKKLYLNVGGGPGG